MVKVDIKSKITNKQLSHEKYSHGSAAKGFNFMLYLHSTPK